MVRPALEMLQTANKHAYQASPADPSQRKSSEAEGPPGSVVIDKNISKQAAGESNALIYQEMTK